MAKGEEKSQKSVFRFHVRDKRWDKAADMKHARACHGVALVYEKIMAVGGKDDRAECVPDFNYTASFFFKEMSLASCSL